MQERFILRKKGAIEDTATDAEEPKTEEPKEERKLHLVENKPNMEFDPEKTNAQKGLEVEEGDEQTVVKVGEDFYNDLYANRKAPQRPAFSQGSVDNRLGRKKKR